MKRRHALFGLSAATAALAWPSMITQAFAQTSERAPADAFSSLEQAWREAQTHGRPMLVLVIPNDPTLNWERGRAFGALINHGSDTAMQSLGLAQLACARMSDMRRLFPNTPSGEPLMFLVEPGMLDPAVSALDAAWPTRSETMRAPSFHESRAADDALFTRQLAIVTEILERGLGVRRRRLSIAARRASAARATATYRSQSVPGSHWALRGGCALQVEGHARIGGGCGMGHTPALAERFLYFFAVEES